MRIRIIPVIPVKINLVSYCIISFTMGTNTTVRAMTKQLRSVGKFLFPIGTKSRKSRKPRKSTKPRKSRKSRKGGTKRTKRKTSRRRSTYKGYKGYKGKGGSTVGYATSPYPIDAANLKLANPVSYKAY
jgi:hypothetical protein